MSFEITILGSGAALPTSHRNPTAQYVCCNDRHFLIDCGEGTQVQLRRRHIHIQKITHILISHLHGDHFFGLVGLLSSLHLLGRDKGITIYGPEGLEEIIRMQLEIGGTRLSFSLEFVTLNGQEHRLLYEDKLIEVWTFPLNHRIPTNGFRIQEKPKEYNIRKEKFEEAGVSLTAVPFFKQGKDFVTEDGQVLKAAEFTHPPKKSNAYAYCSDTCYDERLLPYIANATVLYHEATFLEDKMDRAKATFHSTAKQAATMAKKAEVKHLLLGHLSARYDDGKAHEKEAKTVFENSRVVEDGDVISVA